MLDFADGRVRLVDVALRVPLSRPAAFCPGTSASAITGLWAACRREECDCVHSQITDRNYEGYLRVG